MSADKLRKIWLWITAALLVVMAILLIVGCLGIYAAGDRPFSRESVSAVLKDLTVPGMLCILMIIIGAFLPGAKAKRLHDRDEKALLARFHQQIPEAIREQKLRMRCRIVVGVAITALWVYPLVYFCDFDHFTISNLSADIARAVLIAAIPGVITLGLLFAAEETVRRSVHRELEMHKKAGNKPSAPGHLSGFSPKKRNVVRICLFAAAVVFVILGIRNGGAADVLGKAIRICTECIGLG